MALEFKERSTLGRAWFVEVRRGKVLIGTIGQSAGEYRYYRGKDNQLNPAFTDPDLDALKLKIQASETPGSN